MVGAYTLVVAELKKVKADAELLNRSRRKERAKLEAQIGVLAMAGETVPQDLIQQLRVLAMDQTAVGMEEGYSNTVIASLSHQRQPTRPIRVPTVDAVPVPVSTPQPFQ